MKSFAILASFLIMLGSGNVGGQSEAAGEQIWIPAKEKAFGGAIVDIKLDAVLYRPKGAGPFPVVIFNHGGTGGSRRNVRYPEVAQFFVDRGMAVLEPARRGINGSGGAPNDPTNCDVSENTRAVVHAMEDIDAVVAYAKSQPFLDASRLLIAGNSRGGVLSIVYAARRPDVPVKGVINFVGVWSRDSCRSPINDTHFSEAGSLLKSPTLWLYAERDSLTSSNSARSYAESFRKTGGDITFHLIPHDIGEGHFLLQRGSKFWLADFGRFLDRLGFALVPGSQ